MNEKNENGVCEATPPLRGTRGMGRLEIDVLYNNQSEEWRRLWSL